MILCEPSIASSWCCGGMAGSVTPQGVRLQEKCCGGHRCWGRLGELTPTSRRSHMEGAAASVGNTKKLLEADRAGRKAGLEGPLKAEPGLTRCCAAHCPSARSLSAL